MQTSEIHLWIKASISKLELRFDEVVKEFGFIQSE
jgi:hypothetical protein